MREYDALFPLKTLTVKISDIGIPKPGSYLAAC